jgi:squalene-hopene/tetraprenyl-beta-curcumene cyclase
MKRLASAVVICGLFCSAARAADSTQPAMVAVAQRAIDRGVAFLTSQQKADGGWERSEAEPPAISALVLKAIVQNPAGVTDHGEIDRGFAHLLSFQKPDGGIYRDLIASYNTAIAITALAAAKNPAYDGPVQKALGFLRRLQWNDQVDAVAGERQQVPASDPRYGGFGYGKRSRPDGSNLQIALDALHDAGVKRGDPAYTAAVAFVSRLQNRSESNDQPWAGDDGGFIYTDADGGDSPAGKIAGAGGKTMFRSYGSMTYAGLKSMIYAGLSKDDPRVVSAVGWISHHWTWDHNPGIQYGAGNVSESGLYYYFHTASRALAAYGEPVIRDAQGVRHDWRAELIAKIASLQRADGSWAGQAKWMESNPVLASSFAILSLEEARASVAE